MLSKGIVVGWGISLILACVVGWSLGNGSDTPSTESDSDSAHRPLSGLGRSGVGIGGSIARIAELAKSGDLRSQFELRQVLGRLSATEIESLLAGIGGSDRFDAVLLQSVLLERMAEIDGRSAIDHALGLSGSVQAFALPKLMQAWARTDPHGALDWFVEQREQGMAGLAMEGATAALPLLFGGLIERGASDALVMLGRLSDPAHRAMAVAGFASACHDESVFRDLIFQLSTPQQASHRQPVYETLLRQLAAIDPSRAITMLNEVEGQDGVNIDVLNRAAAMGWLRTEPKSAAEWMLTNSSSETLAHDLRTIASSWSATDPNAAAEWFGKRQFSAETDQAVYVLAKNAAKLDPESGVHWATRITDERVRSRTVLEMYRNWFRSDGQAAETYLRDSDLPEAIKTAYLESFRR